MSSEWRRYSVSELQASSALFVEDGNHGGYRPLPNEFVSDGVSFIRAADMAGGHVLFDTAERINEDARRRIRKGIGRPGDVLLSHKGTVGKVALVPAMCPEFVCSPQTTFWRTLDEAVLDRGFLFSYLQSQDFRNQLASRKSETDMADYVSLTAQRQLTVLLPPIETQRLIGSFALALHNRISLLRETNATLEAIAQALFKSWFVDFDPVRAKQQGLVPEGMDETTATLFPDSLTESVFGLVPLGWPVGAFSDLFQIPLRNGLTRPKSVRGAGTRMVNMGEIFKYRKIGNIAMDRVPLEGAERERNLLVAGDLLFARQSLTLAGAGQCSIVIEADEPRTFESHLIRCRLDGCKADPWFFYYYFLSAKGQARIASIVEQVAAAGIRGSDLARMKVLVPPVELQWRFAELISPLEKRIAQNDDESRTLASIRDALLPRLISGQLRLPEVEAMLEAAA